MKKKLIAMIGIIIMMSGCGAVQNETEQASGENVVISVTDSASNAVELENIPENVFSLSSSFAEIWLLAGGKLSGVTSDAFSDRDLGIPEDTLVLGTVKEPNMELILSEEPDLVILSQDIVFQISSAETFQKSNIPHYIAKVDTLDDYLKVLKDFTTITGYEDNFHQNGELVKNEVDLLLSRVPQLAQEEKKTALFLRAFSSDVKVKANDHTVCYILDDIGVENIAVREGFPLEELSVEAVIEADPDYIFIVAMGDEEAANTYLEQSLFSNPAWGNLSAVKNGNAIMLDKSLYHYKPNNRWGDAYETILQIVYPDIYGKQ